MRLTRLAFMALLALFCLSLAPPASSSASACCCCEALDETDLPLEGTLWKLSMLADQPVAASPRQPHMTLNAEQHSVGGNGGCNGFGGNYRHEGEKLSFSQLISTMMYCEETMETEKAFFAALESSATYSIDGRGLQIFNAEGVPLASFEGSAAAHSATEVDN